MGVAENIDALLVKFDITAESLARIAGVQPPTVSRWRHGAMPREEPINRMVEYFGLERDDIVSDAFGLAAKEHGRVGIPTIKPAYSYHVVPMLGNVAAGEWREVYEQHGEEDYIPDEFAESHPRRFRSQAAGVEHGSCISRRRDRDLRSRYGGARRERGVGRRQRGRGDDKTRILRRQHYRLACREHHGRRVPGHSYQHQGPGFSARASHR